jgi:hypothetical protein
VVFGVSVHVQRRFDPKKVVVFHFDSTHVKAGKLLRGCCQVHIRMCLLPVVVASLEQVAFTLTRLVMVTDLLQVVPTRLIQAVCKKLLRACCHQLAYLTSYAQTISDLSGVLGTTCCESVDLINLVKRCSKTH